MVLPVRRALVPSLRALVSPFSKTLFSFSSAGQANTENGRKDIEWYGNESLNIKVSVWWDFENCQIPVTVNAYHIAPRIQAALRSSGVKGPVTIHAYGDVFQLCRHAQEAIAATGIGLTHVPRGGKDSADRALLVDLLFWASDNPPPAHLFLISGDGDFASILHRLQMKNYNILLAKAGVSTALYSTASIVWQWDKLVTGRRLQGNKSNCLPDATSGSRSGQPVGSIGDAYDDVELETSNDAMPKISEGAETEFSHELDLKPRQIPHAVLKQTADILKSYPQGLDLNLLQKKIARNYRGINKDYFGRRKFLEFLKDMPNILKLSRHDLAKGKVTYLVHPVSTRIVDQSSKQQKGFIGRFLGKWFGSGLTDNGENVYDSKDEDIKAKNREANEGNAKNEGAVADGMKLNGFTGRVFGKWFGSGLTDSR